MSLAPSDRKLLLVTAAVFVVVTIAAVVTTEPAGERGQVPPTTYSAASGGAKAAYLLLKESGRNVRRWEQPMAALPRESSRMTYVLAEPQQLPQAEDRAALARFVSSGGRVVAAGPLAARFLPQEATAGIGRQFVWVKPKALTPSPLVGSPQITIREDAHWRADEKDFVALYGDSAHDALAVHYRYGKGDVVWWAAATPLTNAGITEPGNLEFFLASIGDEPGQRVLFDEYFHGFGHGGAASPYQYPLHWGLLQMALLAVAIVVTFSRRSGPVQAPRPETRLSPLEFVETLGGLYQRARAARVAVEVAYQRFRYLLTRRLGLPANSTAEEMARAARELLAYNDPKLGTTLRACEQAASQGISPRDALAIVRSLQEIAVELKLIRTAGKD